MMLSKKAFAEGIKKINSILSKNAKIETNDSLDTYYTLLMNFDDKDFLMGVVDLMKTLDNPHFPPGPGAIRNHIEKIMYCGLNKEEFVLVASIYKQQKLKHPNEKLNELIHNTDINELKTVVISNKKLLLD